MSTRQNGVPATRVGWTYLGSGSTDLSFMDSPQPGPANVPSVLENSIAVSTASLPLRTRSGIW